MISKDELKELSKYSSYNLGQVEKSFFQDLILFILYRQHSRDLVFKGGTALSKCFGMDRFSEDLDFTTQGKAEAIKKTIEDGLKHFSVAYELSSTKGKDSWKYKILVQGPLYNNTRQSFSSIGIDLSTREKIILEPIIVKYRPLSNLIPMSEIVVMDKKEIFAEKIRAIFSRDQARDLYDISYLERAIPDISIIDIKLRYYGLKFSGRGLKEAIQRKEKIWDKEMKHLVKSYPRFEDVKKKIFAYFKPAL